MNLKLPDLVRGGMSLFVLMIICSGMVTSLGISPPKVVYDYSGPFSDEIAFTVRSNSPFPAIIGVNITGAMTEYATIINKEFRLESQSRAGFKIVLDIPGDHGLVGKQVLWIEAAEIEVIREDSASIMFATGVSPAIVVNFPYPGKFLEIYSARIKSVNEGENSEFLRKVISRGEQDASFTSKLVVRDNNDQMVVEQAYPSVFIKGMDTYSKTDTIITNNLVSGKYTTEFTIYYDGEEKTQKSTFQVGEENITLVDYRPKVLPKGEISEMVFEIENMWNGDFDNVYGIMTFENVSASTPSEKLTSFGKVKLRQFMDFRSYDVGEYEGSIEVHFDDNVREFSLTIGINESEVEPEKTKTPTMTILLYSSLAVLIIFLILLVILLLKSKKKQNL